MSSWNTGWRRMGSPGIYSCGGSWRIRVRKRDPRTGSRLERNRILNGASSRSASHRASESRSSDATG